MSSRRTCMPSARTFSLRLMLLFAAVASNPGNTQLANPWTHIQNLPGGNACAARLAGGEVDTMLMLNEVGQLILVAGRPDWQISGSQEVRLKIDGVELSHLQASAFNNLVLLPIIDKAAVERLKIAKNLYWTLPFGKYHVAIAGLGDALAWVQQCEQRKRHTSN